MDWRILTGDVREQLQTVEAGSVRCCVTSPPYWGLRDYGTAQWEGGTDDCNHSPRAQVANSKTASNAGALRDKPSLVCGCGARRIDSQIGLEPTPDAYVASLVAVFSDVRRVLADDGTLWLNLGDSYSQSGKGGNPEGSQWAGFVGNSDREASAKPRGLNARDIGMKPKDLVGIPWRVAFALQADGWYLRSDIIWSKPNPMPESVTDRPTKAHEYIFLLSKSARYYYNAAAIAEPLAECSVRRYQHAVDTNEQFDPSRHKSSNGIQSPMEVLTRAAAGVVERGTRNKRTVWTIATQSYDGAHFATFPPDLIEPCILAGSAIGDIVLDPFCGSGTTGVVAIRHQRRFLGVELNPEYVKLAEKRIRSVAPLFVTGHVVQAPVPPSGRLVSDPCRDDLAPERRAASVDDAGESLSLQPGIPTSSAERQYELRLEGLEE